MKEQAIALLQTINDALKAGLSHLPVLAEKVLADYQRYLLYDATIGMATSLVWLAIAGGGLLVGRRLLGLAASVQLPKESAGYRACEAAEEAKEGKRIAGYLICGISAIPAMIGLAVFLLSANDLAKAIAPIGYLLSRAIK